MLDQPGPYTLHYKVSVAYIVIATYFKGFILPENASLAIKTSEV